MKEGHRRMSKRITLIGIAALSLALTAAPAFAARGGGGKLAPSGPSIKVDQSSPALGSSVTFTSSYPGSTKNPRIQVMCYQNGQLVYGEAGAADHIFLLGGNPDRGSIWRMVGGSASCTADLFDLIWNGNNPQQVAWLATTSFNAAG
jgi:hypothetical protein